MWGFYYFLSLKDIISDLILPLTLATFITHFLFSFLFLKVITPLWPSYTNT